MMDDILDYSSVRRNRPAWQIVTEQEGRMELSYNDCHFLKEIVFLILRKYCRNKPYYQELLDTYRMISSELAVVIRVLRCPACKCSTIGLTLDAMMHKNITLFNEDLYSEIATNKACYPTFVMTVETAFHAAGFYNEDSWQQIEDIIVDFGTFHQIRNDYQGYKEDVKRGKPEEDIQLGQCTWFIVQALKLADSTQKATLQKYFGKSGTENALEVSNVYDQLDLPSKYAIHANGMYKNMIEKIDRLPDELVRQALRKVLKVLIDFSDATFQK